LEALKRTPSAIALAVGSEKATSIIGAARGGYMNELITDAATAETVLVALNDGSGERDGQ
jgi:DNA-binding transcriptional regulator LsrR (DeoR family)